MRCIHALESTKDISTKDLEVFLSLARQIKQNPSEFEGKLKGKTVLNCFLTPSTRTQLSFSLAAQRLGAYVLDFHEQVSSFQKGESFQETFQVFESLEVDLCVLRSTLKKCDFINNMKWINAGNATGCHPTQVLGDYFLIKDQGISLKKIVFLGDSLHSRVAHDWLNLLAGLDCSVALAGPKNLLIPGYQCCSDPNDLLSIINESSLVYVLRPQKEWHKGAFGLDDYARKWCLDDSILKNITVPIFHPGPMNLGVDVATGVFSHPFYMGKKQVSYALYARMAVLYLMLGGSL